MNKSRRTNRRAVHANGSISDIRLVEIWLYLLGVIWWLLTVVFRAWRLNPVSFLWHRMRTMYTLDGKSDLPIQPKWTERIRDLFISDVQRKIRLLQWVKSRVNHVKIDDFVYSWQDGIALCALLESVSPGVCPRYHLLKSVLRVNNCRFGLQIAHKFLNIQRVVITPEEMAIAAEDTELKIVHLVQMIRWKHQRMPKIPAHARPVALPVRRVLSRCFARGTGLKTAMVGRRAKFNIITDCDGTLELLVEIMGPHGEMNSERISSHQPESPPRQQRESSGNSMKPPSEHRSKIITDSEGNRFIRQKSFDEDSNQAIPFDYQSIGEGRFLVTYVPRNTGVHDIVIKSHDHHIQGSPYQVSVSDWSSSWNVVGKSTMMTLGTLPTIREGAAKMRQLQEEVSNRFLDAGVRSRRHRGNAKQLTIAKRRVVKRMITRNGEEVILSDYSPSPSLSRQSSIDLSEDSEDEQKRKDSEGRPLTAKANKGESMSECKTIKDDIYIPEEETPNDTSDSLSVVSVDSDSKKKSLSKEIKKVRPSIKKKSSSQDIKEVKASIKKISPSQEVEDVQDCVSGSSDLSVHDSTHKPAVYTSMSHKMGGAVEPGRDSSDKGNDNGDEMKLLKTGNGDKQRAKMLSGMSARNSSKHQSKERKGHSDRGVSSSSTVTPPCFKSIVGHQSCRQSWTNSNHVVIVVPTAKVDKTTQVTGEEIKNATGWHSGAFKIKKRKIYINQSNIEQKSLAAKSDILSDNDDMNGFLIGNAQNIQRNVLNVEEWLHSNGSDIFGAPSDRQSTFDTCDSGIADENVSFWNHGYQNGHRRISRRQRSSEIQFHPGIFNHLQQRRRIQFQGGSRRGTVHVPFSGKGELVEDNCSTDQLNFSDSELEYSSSQIQQRNRVRLKIRTSCNGNTLNRSKVSPEKDEDRSTQQYLKRQASFSGQIRMKAPSSKCQGCCDNQRDSGDIIKSAPSDTVGINSNDSERVSSLVTADEHGNGSQHSIYGRSQSLGERTLLRYHDTLLKKTEDPPRTRGSGIDGLNGDKQDNPEDEHITYEAADTETKGNDPPVQAGKQDHNLMKEVDSVKMVTGSQSLTERGEGSSLNHSPVLSLKQNTHDVKTIQESSNPDSTLPDSDFIDEAWFSKLFPKSVLELLANNPFSGAAGVGERLPGDLGEEEDCLAFGAGLSYGHVGMKNNFQVRPELD
ncbi:dentin sialophosphoprotein-like [Haliotis rubra]|uniref:dentin sialophosphoprotein-like n=1 Tax=Haliotis rubra TaxID=36100 RepID=UPI001EE5E8E7|nr:dentin sialophosphoprotein-like [Haliotis rubra]